jgi:hypothetical protein
MRMSRGLVLPIVVLVLASTRHLTVVVEMFPR